MVLEFSFLLLHLSEIGGLYCQLIGWLMSSHILFGGGGANVLGKLCITIKIKSWQ